MFTNKFDVVFKGLSVTLIFVVSQISKVVEEVTYEPKLCTFDMDIMDNLNIKEDRTPLKTYWY